MIKNVKEIENTATFIFLKSLMSLMSLKSLKTLKALKGLFLFFIFCSWLFVPCLVGRQACSLMAADTATSTGATTVSASHTLVPTPQSGTGGETADITPPSAVINLAAGSATATTITLSWTAPGDDADSGTATQYDIRYALSTITDVNWASATAISNAPTPAAAGATQSVVVSGLTPETTYYFALKTVDEASHWSGLSNSPSAKTLASGPPPDTTPPIISNVQTSLSGTGATITFNTDEAATSTISYGLTTSYELGEIKQTQFLTNHSFVLADLTSEKTYHFKIKAADVAYNERISEDQTFVTLDVTPPVVSDVQVLTDVISTHITWQTNELADSQIAYGLTNKLGTISSDVHLVTDHSLEISGLKANTKYFFVARSTDASGNQGSSDLLNFTTLKDANPPANVSNLQAIPGDQTVNLSWQNPADIDLAGILIRRSTSDYPKNPTEGEKVYQAAGQSFQDVNLVNNILYYYTVFAYDTSDNYASGALINATPQAAFIPQCRDDLDNDGDGQIDFPDDLGCSGLDDNDETTPVIQTQCNDGLDNDSDGKVDYPADPGCASSADNDEADEAAPPPPVPLPPPGGVGAATKEFQLSVTDFSFGLVKGKINVPSAPKMSALVGAGFSVALAPEKGKKTIESVILNFANGSYLFAFNETTKQWQTEISAPRQPGIYQADILVNFYDKSASVVSWQLEALPYGQIFEKVNGKKKPLTNVKVTLLQGETPWPAENFFQTNPQITGQEGAFGFLAPVGQYYLEAAKDGYRTERISLDVQTAVVDFSLELLAIPKSWQEVIDPKASLLENAGNVAQNLGEQATFASKVVAREVAKGVKKTVKEAGKIAANPQVQAAARDVAAPVVAGAAAAGTAATVGFAPFLNYLRFLFTQPALLFRRRRRRGWGVIYNSLTKMPIELMTIRLLNQAGQVIQSRVTDKEGRYAFFPSPGFYRLEINHPQFKFPSDFLGALKEDGSYLDIYHGEAIEVKEKGAMITVNVPLDPIGAERPIGRLLWQLTWRHLQHSLSIGSLVLAGLFLIWVPSWLTAGLSAVQVGFYFFFRRLALPPRPKSWGIISDEADKKPLGRAIARIFDKQYNKLLETQIADQRGRYSFLVGRNEYFMTYEKDGYYKKQSEPVDLKNHPEPVASVGVDVALKPLGSQPPELLKPLETPQPPESTELPTSSPQPPEPVKLPETPLPPEPPSPPEPPRASADAMSGQHEVPL